MYKIIIEGNNKLSGKIRISGSKNSAVALVPAAVLCDEEVTIANVPSISDIDALDEILKFLGAKVKRKDDVMKIDSSNIENKLIPEKISKKLRASYYFMGALLSKNKNVATLTISGSLAAFSIIVSPLALTEAKIVLIVAPTLGISKYI